MNELIFKDELKKIYAMENTELPPAYEYNPDFLDSFEEIEAEMDADIDIWARPEDDWSWSNTEAAEIFAA